MKISMALFLIMQPQSNRNVAYIFILKIMNQSKIFYCTKLLHLVKSLFQHFQLELL